MAELDTDLKSIQEVRNLAVQARAAQRQFFNATQEQVDRICAAMAQAAYANALPLAQMAVEETTYGRVDHKVVKNQFGSRMVWDSLKDVKTVGVIRRDEQKKIVEIGWPFGVIAAFTPSTNPTSTAMFKVLIAVKARNAIVLSPHPSAVKCTAETVRVMAEAGERAGMPKGLVSSLTNVTIPALNELMKHWAVSLILATGGSAVVNAAHSSGKPAIGVGPGNVPAYIDRSADVPQAVRDIVNSKTFDYSTICASEQSMIVDAPIEKQVLAELDKNGAYFMDDAQIAAMSKIIHRPDGLPNPKAVGKSPQVLAQMAGITVPANARVLIARLKGVGPEYPLSREKLTSVLAYYVEDGWRAGCERCIEQLKFGGDGHTLAIHCRDENVIMQFGLEKPAFRIVVNTLATLGAIGYTTNLDPSMTLATGGIGGGVYGDNITVRHVMNIKRIAWGVREWTGVEASQAAPSGYGTGSISETQLEEIVRRVMAELRR
ncbi:MAG: acetaldehyde dehydrogenase (acetylating) [Anaerolineae bacterium]